MEGIFFYWFLWMGWVVSAFFMKKEAIRTRINILILLLLVVSPYTFSLFSLSLSLPFCMLLIISLYVVSKNTFAQILYYIISSLIITLAFVSFHLFELFDPVWLIFNRKWMLSLLIIYLTLMLCKTHLQRIITAIIGSCMGELLYFYILRNYNFPYEIGSYLFLDVIAISIGMLSLWYFFEKVASSLEVQVQKGLKGRVSN